MRKINELAEAWTKAALAGDWATATSFYLDGAVAYPPNEPAVEGRAAIRAWLERMPPIEELKLSLVKVEGRDDLAYVLSTNRTSMALPGVPGPVKDSGKSVVVVVERRQPDGRWLIEADISNSDLPAAPPQN